MFYNDFGDLHGVIASPAIDVLRAAEMVQAGLDAESSAALGVLPSGLCYLSSMQRPAHPSPLAAALARRWRPSVR